MALITEQKSQLARLLATENLIVEHKKIHTAAFDPKNRVLYCPIWQDMESHLYDLLIGHEVGHALYTPPEGWHEAASSRGANFKGFLNVVEDARIEKKVKRKYPGLNAQFIKAYRDLIARDFFGIKGKDIQSLSFVDRLNIHTKVGEVVDISFTDEEQKLVDEVRACESWEDVLRVTQAVFDYSKEEQFETMQSMSSMGYKDSDDDMEDEYGESYDSDYENDEESKGEKRETENSGEEGKEKTETKSNSGKGETDDQHEGLDEDNGENINRYKDSQSSTHDQTNFEPSCETDKTFRGKEDTLLDDQCKEFVYVKIPKPNLENIVTPASVVHKHLSNFYFGAKDSDFTEYNIGRVKQLTTDYKRKNESYIGLLAKEFEMKKAAKAFAKAKVANTGDIDISRLYRYQVDDNIFRKTMRVPKGKSHGLVLLLDRSGSMTTNMGSSLEQIMVLSAFCRRVKIPLVVYGFGDAVDGRMADYPDGKYRYDDCFSKNEGELRFGDLYLREYLSSKMSTIEYNTAMRNLFMLKASYEGGRYRPINESLGNTPLIQALVALESITNDFRKVNNLDMVNLVIVHDGDADRINSTHNYREEMRDGKSETRYAPQWFENDSKNVFIRDGNKQMRVKPVKHDYYTSHDEGLRVAMFDWFKAKTGVKIFGFFLAGEKTRMRQAVTQKYIDKNGNSVYKLVQKQYDTNNRYLSFDKTDFVKNLCSQIRENKFIESYNKGYDSFYIMPGGSDLSIEDDELVISGNFTANKLKNAFLKMNKKRQFSRVMVSKFIEGIAS